MNRQAAIGATVKHDLMENEQIAHIVLTGIANAGHIVVLWKYREIASS
ncbi:MAG: hypothetical protein ACXWF8_07920 [Methylobacter sp.]